MTAVRARENTFKIDLSNFPKRPSFEEIHGFIHDTIGLTVEQVLRLQMNHAQVCAHVKCCDLKTAQDVVDRHNNRHELEVNKTKVKVRLVMDDGGVEVKIHDLSENVRNDDIVAYLQQYGDVVSIKEQVWGQNFAFKGISSGVRVAKVILRRHIKSFVTICGEETLISYRNQPQWCRHCTNPSHPGSTCVENKKLLGQKTDLNNRLKAAQSKSSYANVLNQPAGVASLMPEFVGTNLNQLNDLARSSRAQTVDDGNRVATLVSCSTISPPPETDKRMDENEGTTNGEDNTAVAAAAVAAADGSSFVIAAAAVVASCSTVTGTATDAACSTITDADAAVAELANGTSEKQAVKGQLHRNASPCQVSLFKVPLPSKSLSMEISESESNESSTEGGPFVLAKRGRGRPKKQKLNPSSA